MNNIEIIICTEKGYLESLSKLLIASLREFGGNFRDVPIFSYQPRKNLKVSNKTIAFFEKYNVEYVALELNKKFDYYPLANKPLACAHREANTNADILIFLDSDVFFLNEPNEFINFEDADVILRPVDNKGIGTEISGDKNAIYWSDLYNLLNVKVSRNVTTTVGNEFILEYYNTGHIVTLKKSDLFKTWNENFLKVMNAEIKPNKGLYFVEQSVFSATVSQMELKVKNYSKEYNYPIILEHKFKDTKGLVDNLDNLVSIHYHKIFKNPDTGNLLKKRLLETMKGKKIVEMINEYDVLQKNHPLTDFRLRLRKKIDSVKRAIKW